MTMIQAVLRPDHAWVVSDSVCCDVRSKRLVYDPDGRERVDRKLIALPRCVITGLGSLALRNRMEAHAHMLTDVDAAIERLPQIQRDGHRELGLTGMHTGVVIGWSAARGHMALVAFGAENDFEPEVYGSAVTGYFCFWRNPDAPHARSPSDLHSLIANAHATVEHWRGIDPATPIGGALRLASISRDGITLSIAGDLGMPTHEMERDMSSKSIAAAALLALAACGGGDDAVEGQQLQPSAATVATVSKLNFARAGLSSTVDITTDANTLFYTNDTSGTISVQVEFSCAQIYLYVWSDMSVHQVWLAQTGAVGGSTDDVITNLDSGLDLHDGVSKVFQYSLAPGATLNVTVKLRRVSTNVAAAINMDQSILRLSAIKR